MYEIGVLYEEEMTAYKQANRWEINKKASELDSAGG